MSDNIPERGGSDRLSRLAAERSKDQQEIQDWLNGSGQMVIALIVVAIVAYAIVTAVIG